MGKKFYVTTPIYYTSGPPHVGTAYTTIAADVISRFYKLMGWKVFFSTGTDEHGKNIQQLAKEAKKEPKQFVDELALKFKEAWKKLGIEYSRFIRTTEPTHEEAVKRVLTALLTKKIIYKGTYEGLYCVKCEQYLSKTDLVEGKCPFHKIEPELRKEEAYLFKLSAFTEKLKDLIRKDKLKIVPETKKREILAFLEQGLHDIPISRRKEEVSWAIELPFDPAHTCYVWVDAFWNYLTAIGWPEPHFRQWWPPSLQLMSKDIIRVHATIWPALLLSLGLKLPEKLFVHGFLTISGQKISKSLGPVIDPCYLADKYGADSVRYYLLRAVPFGEDGDVSEQALIARHNHELADKLGNLFLRVTALAEKYGIKRTKNTLLKKLKLKQIKEHMLKLEFDKALAEIFAFIDECNAYVQLKHPWETHDACVIYELLDSIRVIAILLWPFMPQTAEKIAAYLGSELSFKQCKASRLKEKPIEKAPILFAKIEERKEEKKEEVKKESGERKVEATQISFSEWQKLDLRVGRIVEVKLHPQAEKLYLLDIELGTEKRTLVAGLKEHYKPEQLKGKLCVVLVNLEPKVIRGIESKGMILAAEQQDKIVLIVPEQEIAPGAKIK